MATEVKLQTIRETYKKTLKKLHPSIIIIRQRYGFFSIPPSIAHGDNSYFTPTACRKGDDKKVTIGPKNFLTTKIKKGSLDSVLLSKPSYVTVGDKFQDCYKLKFWDIEPNDKAVTHEKVFKPNGPFQVKFTTYEHKEEGIKPKVVHKDENGKVPLNAKNFYTSPPKKGIANATVK